MQVKFSNHKFKTLLTHLISIHSILLIFSDEMVRYVKGIRQPLMSFTHLKMSHFPTNNHSLLILMLFKMYLSRNILGTFPD